MTTRKTRSKPIVIVIPNTCPHCSSQRGCTKLAGAYKTDEHNGQQLKYFRVRCKACESIYVVKEIRELSLL